MFDTRASGILVHPTSFPSPYGMGDLGVGAYAFIDFLKVAKQTLWQVLPLGPTGYGDSPYQSFSTFAGNHYLISPEELKKQGWLTFKSLESIPKFNPRRIEFGEAIKYKMKLLKEAYKGYKQFGTKEQKKDVAKFSELHKDWLDDYALFYALKDYFGGREWHKWTPALAKREKSALNEIRRELADTINFCKFIQCEFFRQWKMLKKYANDNGIKIIGDIPIFVAEDSADVWASPELYELDSNGRPTAVAGVPPDYFSETGQLWGNPLYKWQAHKDTDYKWWCRRITSVLDMVDIVRIDHFRGFESYWAVPYGEKTAINGEWLKGPGTEVFEALKKAMGDLPIIAEDLGDITPEVHELRNKLKLPGMRVLQFGFSPNVLSIHAPHNFESNLNIVYTGTHDNNTSVGWYLEIPENEKDYLRRYMNISGDDVAWDLIRLAMASNAIIAITPIQDVMNLPAQDRMNLPGNPQGWWSFRYTENMLLPEYAKGLAYLTELFQRYSYSNDSNE